MLNTEIMTSSFFYEKSILSRFIENYETGFSYYKINRNTVNFEKETIFFNTSSQSSEVEIFFKNKIFINIENYKQTYKTLEEIKNIEFIYKERINELLEDEYLKEENITPNEKSFNNLINFIFFVNAENISIFINEEGIVNILKINKNKYINATFFDNEVHYNILIKEHDILGQESKILEDTIKNSTLEIFIEDWNKYEI